MIRQQHSPRPWVLLFFVSSCVRFLPIYEKPSAPLGSSDGDSFGATNPFRYFCQELG
jgi:hypothetical protein